MSTSNNIENTSLVSEKKQTIQALNLLEDVIRTMKKDRRTTDIVQKVISITKNSKAGEMDKLCKLLNNVLDVLSENKGIEDLQNFELDMKRVFLTKELRNLLVKESSYKVKIIGLLPFVQTPLVLGEGGFAVVLAGTYRKNNKRDVDVAIKRPKGSMINFAINEALVLAELDHPNIIRIIGYDKGNFAILLEHMSFGDLRQAITKLTFTKENIIKFMIEVCKGMEYMAKKKFIHRDLAMRNVFLNSKQQIKIGDFGFTQYVGDSNGVFIDVLGLRNYNVSPESRETKEFRIETDVYAMGVLIWETFFELERPEGYSSFRVFDEIDLLIVSTFPRSPKCPENVYKFAREACMHHDYKSRPDFTNIKAKLEEFLKNI